jgi:hypothetical protein
MKRDYDDRKIDDRKMDGSLRRASDGCKRHDLMADVDPLKRD